MPDLLFDPARAPQRWGRVEKVCDQQICLLSGTVAPQTQGSRNGDAIVRPAPTVGHRSRRWCEVSGCAPTAKVGPRGFGRGDAVSHVDALGSERVGHRLGVSPKRIARKSRNRRCRVCISAPFTVSQLRVCTQRHPFKYRPLPLPFFASFRRLQVLRLPCSADRWVQTSAPVVICDGQ